jgi:response regulator RpfG family c-di-GMP phosphodiesterase
MTSIQHIIIISDFNELEQVRHILSSEKRFEFIPAQSLNEAMGFLGIFPDIKSVTVYQKKIVWKKDDPPKVVKDYLKANTSSPFFFWVGPCELPEDKQIRVLPEDIMAEELLRIIKDFTYEGMPQLKEEANKKVVVVDVAQPSNPDQVLADYSLISIEQLKSLDVAPVDLFIKLGEEEKFVKRFSRDAPIEKDFLEKCLQRNVQHLFLRTEDRGVVTQYLTRILLEKIRNLDGAENDQNQGSILELVYNQIKKSNHVAQESLKEIGLKEEVMVLATETVNTVVRQLEKNRSLVNNIRKIMLNSSSLSYRHSYMSMMIAYSVLNQFSWANRIHYESIVFCGFFHDISLNKESLISIQNNDELTNAKLDEKELALVKRHALLSSEFIQNKTFPGEADVIIRQHHGSETGEGFVNQVNDKIHRLALIFMISEAFTMRVIKSSNGQIDIAGILKDILQSYTGSHVGPVVMALKKAITTGGK